VKRRQFITLLSRAAAAWPFAARAQQATKTYRIALVNPSLSVAEMTETTRATPFYPVLFKELRRLGYVEGVNMVGLADTFLDCTPANERDPHLAR
jgi:putative tryptophan/tyrosine transport system substrate-binding protein